ncbi:hypothetical protein A0H81_03895 [Grifola frondosa]|uniref:Uncharacterized protein n=1 Tax=Grifola frondosa TaxID=5627 RepID=A0A1C7MIE4_GRIFR|nr:hypothetical protein A0H81_03895 [Grifola frondosa]
MKQSDLPKNFVPPPVGMSMSMLHEPAPSAHHRNLSLNLQLSVSRDWHGMFGMESMDMVSEHGIEDEGVEWFAEPLPAISASSSSGPDPD